VNRPDPTDHPNVIILPPLLILMAMAATVGLHLLVPLPIDGPRSVTIGVGLGIAALALAFAAWGRRTMIRGGTNVRPTLPTVAIVTGGPFRFSRNPLYVTVTIAYVGLSIALGTWWWVVVLIPVALLLHFGVVLREEIYLENKFGDGYRAYKQRVRRYL
jgi:protein-S-isoprenylcysteine O-methyltransferase Ste14